MLAEKFAQGHAHHEPIPPVPQGQAQRRYVPLANDNGVITRTVGYIEGEDGYWPMYFTEACPPPLQRHRIAAALEKRYWRGVIVGATLGIIGSAAGMLLFVWQHSL